jgi:hypothetical protein
VNIVLILPKLYDFIKRYSSSIEAPSVPNCYNKNTLGFCYLSFFVGKVLAYLFTVLCFTVTERKVRKLVQCSYLEYLVCVFIFSFRLTVFFFSIKI